MSYSTVIWSEDDELTSAKLQQMSDNTEWLKSNSMSGEIYLQTPGEATEPGAPILASANPTNIRSERATKVLGLRGYFETDVPALHYHATFRFPNVFTAPPIIMPSIQSGYDLICFIAVDTDPTSTSIRIMRRDGATSHFYGDVHVLLLGR
jgi:hypothetical protein